MSDSEDESADDAVVATERHDPTGLITQPAEGWQYKPRAVVTLLKDAASSATIAARHVFCYGGSYPMTPEDRDRARHDPDPEEDLPILREITCHMHASLRWCQINSTRFNGYTSADGDEFSRVQARNQFQQDLDRVIKNLQFPFLKPVAISLLKKNGMPVTILLLSKRGVSPGPGKISPGLRLTRAMLLRLWVAFHATIMLLNPPTM